MSFRRLPFQFSTTDPVERQRELERRFGLPSNRNMFVDVTNPLSTGIVPKDSSITSSSPRLQHRVPIFVDGYDKPIHSSVDSAGTTTENKKSNVRVIPIEIEENENRPISARHRTFSGPAGIPNDCNKECISQMEDMSPLKHSMLDLSKPSMIKADTGPRVFNIPIKVEGASNLKSSKFEKVKSPKKNSPKANGCAVSKSKSPDEDHNRKTEQKDITYKQKIGVENSLKKIEDVLEEWKTYDAEVQEFSGTTKDKKYRYLDEMLTRCMLKLDDIDTMGNCDVRSARKNAVKKIQACIDLLENKTSSVNDVVTTSVSESGMQETKETSADSCESTCQNEVEMTESQVVDPEVSENEQKIIPEVSLPQGDATNVCKVEVTEKPAEVPEIQMTELKGVLLYQDLNSETNEVEMNDSTTKPNDDLDNIIPVKEETVAEIANVQLMRNAISREDVEMKDVQSTLDNIKESIAEENADNFITSQPEEKCESDMIIEVNTTDHVAETSLPSEDVCNGTDMNIDINTSSGNASEVPLCTENVCTSDNNVCEKALCYKDIKKDT